MKKIVMLFFLICVLLKAQTENGMAVYNSADNKHQFTIPETWTELQLNENADIQVGNEVDEAYMILLVDSKDDLFGWNLQKHSFSTFANMLSGLYFPKIEGPTEITVAGNKAIKFKLEGTSEDINIVYFHIVIETETNFNQILAWSLKSKFKQNEKLLMDVINSFVEKN